MSNVKQPTQASSATQRWTQAMLITAPLMAFAMLFAAPAANADGYRGGHNAGHHVRGYNRGYNRSFDRGYNRGYNRRLRGFQSRHRGYRYSRNDRRGAYLIGGLVVGSLITHAITNNRANQQHDSRQDRYTSRTYDRNNSYSTYAAGGSARAASDAPISRRLFRDAQGNCFERQTGPDNQELLIDLPAEECRW